MAAYFDATRDVTVTGELQQPDVDAFLSCTLATTSGRGHSALELTREDGSSLTIGTDGERAALVWVNSLGESLHSAGINGGPPLVYDYFGSWSEAPGSNQVSLDDARRCLELFVRHGTPDTDLVLFVPD